MIRISPALPGVALAALVHMAAAEPAPKPPTLSQAKQHFQQADQALNAVWAEVRKSLPAEEFNSLKNDQRAWLEHRDYLALSPSYSGCPPDEQAARQSAEYFDTAAALMEARTDWLKALIHRQAADSLTGQWADSYGGHLDLVEKDGRLHFLLEVVRRPSAHLGGLAGVAIWNEPLGWFSDKGRDESKEDETNLAFILRGTELEIVGANTGAYHGARAYFDGRYVRTKPLDGQATARVLAAAKSGEVPQE